MESSVHRVHLKHRVVLLSNGEKYECSCVWLSLYSNFSLELCEHSVIGKVLMHVEAICVLRIILASG